MAYEGLKGNKNAEIWTEKETLDLFYEAIKLTESLEYDFIGEIAKDQGVYRSLYPHLITRFPECKRLYDIVLSNLEANCFRNAKKGDIKEATAIVNLKSNYKWTDRNDVTSNNKELKGLTTEQREERISELKDKLGIKDV